MDPASVFSLQRAAGNAAVSRMLEDTSVHEVLRVGGTPLPGPLKDEMEARLGADFSDVRLHSGPAAQRSAAEIGARAYTSGNHVVIGDGGGDKHTLAHELIHVLQQRQGPVSGTDNGNGLSVSDPADRFEREAEASAAHALSWRPAEDADPPAARALAGGRPVVQRAVGFEFEAQWKVRRMGARDVDEARLAEEQVQRDFGIEMEILRDVLKSGRQPKGLTKKEAEMRPDDLLSLVVKEDQLTPRGREWYDALKPEDLNAKIYSLKGNKRIPDEPVLGENLSKHDPIVEAVNFDLTADSTPAGGSNLEWVTKPLDNEKQLRTVMDKIVAMAKWLNGRMNEEFIRSEDVTAGGGRPVRNRRNRGPELPDGDARREEDNRRGDHGPSRPGQPPRLIPSQRRAPS